MFSRHTYKDKVKVYICELIFKGELNPGEQIKEKEIATRLGISRAPIREAFRELITEKILEYVPYKGTYLKKTDPRETIEIYSTRGILEGAAVAESLSGLGKRQIQKLSYLNDKMYECAKTGKNRELIEYGEQFHSVLFKNCNNSLLVHETHRLSFICHILFFNHWPRIYSPSQIRIRHKKIIDAIEGRDRIAVERVIRNHYFETGKKISTLIKRGSYE